jgi:hypothetical protein
LDINLTSLSILDGNFSRIKNLNHLTNLRTLSITNSALVEVDGLDHNYNLQTLLLDGNQIRALKKKNIRHLTNIEYLCLPDTRVANLWTTVAALKSLTSLRALTFDLSPVAMSAEESDYNDEEGQSEQNDNESLLSDLSDIENMLEEDGETNESELDASYADEGSYSDLTQLWMRRALDHGLIHRQNYYREFIIHHLPQLESLDERPITEQERVHSSVIVAKHFVLDPFTEHHKYSQKSIPSMPQILKDCQIGTLTSRSMALRTYRKNYVQYAQPKLTRLCSGYRPRQVEYNPTLPGLMLFGTINAEIGVLNYEKNKVLGRTSVEGNKGTVLGLCWLRSNPLRFVAGCDSGHINMLDVNDMIAKKGPIHQYIKFPRLTSISVNSTDELLLTSGYSHNVFVHDLNTSKEVRTYDECHTNYINSAKFANSVPYLFTTSSFDHSLKLFDVRDRSANPIYTRETKNECLMVTWSPDDRYLLLSCADNEVTQFNAVDGSVNLAYPLKPINSEYNYTRSYYINRGQYIIVGSCEQPSIRICSTTDGRLLREVNFDNDVPFAETRLCCQSLRGNPHENFRFSILVAE